ncbi:hypothetical protein LA080_006017 [Diaporthe eres]|nr:hypothetical protein LA080_006017 [Diaporthe eres]
MTHQVNDSIVVARSYGTKRKANELHLSSHDIEYCYYCSEWWSKGESWEQHCLGHLREEVNCYGAWTYGSTIIRPAFCPFCWQDDSLKPSQRMQSWNRNQDAARHIRDSHTSIATHQGPGDMVQPSGPYGDVRAESGVLGMLSSIRPADTSAEFPSSQAPKFPKPQERSSSISEPEETLPPKKRVRLVYKNKLVCSFLA